MGTRDKHYNTKEQQLTQKALAKKMAMFTLEKKASEVIVMDLRKVTDMTDFFVICSADSDVQVKAIADAVMEGTDNMGLTTWHVEGLAQRQWILLDYVDIVVHIFHKEARKFYALEKIWGDAAIETIEDKPPVKRAAKPKVAKEKVVKEKAVKAKATTTEKKPRKKAAAVPKLKKAQ